MHSIPCGSWSRLILQILPAFLVLSLPSPAQTRSGSQEGKAAQQNLTEPPGEIAGHVYRSDTGKPLFDAIVFLVPEKPALGSFPEERSEADGSFDFHSVAPGKYEVDANADGFLSGSYVAHESSNARANVISVGPNDHVTGINIRLDTAGSISGTVSDENGEPARDIKVMAIRPRFEPGGREDVSGGDGRGTEDDGSFHIAGLRPGTYLVRAGGPASYMADGMRYRETYYPGTDVLKNAQTVQVTAGQDSGGIRISVRAEKTFKIFGKIVDPLSSSHRSYEVQVSDATDVRAPVCCNIARASSEKSFTTGGLPSGDYIVSVAAIERGETPSGWIITSRGYARVSIRDKDKDKDISIVTGSGGEIRGKVSIEALNGSIPTPRVALVRASGPSQVVSSDLINSEGEFDIRDIPPGDYRFVVPIPWGAGYLDRARCLGEDHIIDPLEVNVNDVKTDCLLIVRADPGSLQGKVLVVDRPAAGMVVVLEPEEPELRLLEDHVKTARSSSDGQFRISGIIPGKYVIFATPLVEDESYYSPEFIEENSGNLQHVTVLSRESTDIEIEALAAR